MTLAESSTSLDAVQVVGSRSQNRSVTDSPSPVDIIDMREVTAKTGQLDVNQLLQFVAPSFNSNRQTGSDGADHVDPASLRGLGPDQTLVLVNGKRQHQSALVNLFGTPRPRQHRHRPERDSGRQPSSALRFCATAPRPSTAPMPLPASSTSC